MTGTTPTYAAIAQTLRNQQLQEQPLKHEWVELLSRLSRTDDPCLRELGIAELTRCADQATRNRHA